MYVAIQYIKKQEDTYMKEIKRIILTINGKEKVFFKDELEDILEEYFQNEISTQPPIENRWFWVNPQAINREIFKKEREDKQQEKTRMLILEAFDFVDQFPEKYGRAFKTLIPLKKWHGDRTVGELNEQAHRLGNHNADWVEQALEWAQRICNGETWEEICNKDDPASYYRMVFWKNDSSVRLIGGSSANGFNFPATYVYHENYYFKEVVMHTVPLVIRYIDE